jgi:hypothetical protein
MRKEGLGQGCFDGPNKTKHIDLRLLAFLDPSVKGSNARGFIAMQ